MTRTHFFLVAALLLMVAALGSPQSSPVVQPTTTQWEMAQGPLRLNARTSYGLVSSGGGSLDVQIDVAAMAAINQSEPMPVRLALVLDRSCSMHGEKLQHAKQAARSLVGLLSERDSMAIITFSSDVRELALQSADEAGKERMLTFIDQLTEEGGTNVQMGLARARELLSERGGRVVLVSDGQPTEGMVSGEGLAGLCAQMRQRGLTVSALGVGSDYNGVLMQQLAELGGGYYGYLKEPSMLTEVLGRELDQARHAIAGRVQLNIEPARGVRVLEVAGRHFSPRDGVSLPDLTPGASHQVFVRVKVPSSWDSSQPLFSSRLSWVDLRTSGSEQAAVAVAVGTTSSADEVTGSCVTAVQAASVRAFGSSALQQAAVAFESGDRAHAFDLLYGVRAMLNTSADALAGADDIAELDRTAQRWQNTSASGARAESLQLTHKTMKNFGANNSY